MSPDPVFHNSFWEDPSWTESSLPGILFTPHLCRVLNSGLTQARQAPYWLGRFPCQHSAFLKYFLVYETEQKLGNPLLLPHCKTTLLSASCNEGVHLIPSVNLSAQSSLFTLGLTYGGIYGLWDMSVEMHPLLQYHREQLQCPKNPPLVISPSCLAKPLAAANPDTVFLHLSNHMSHSFSDRLLWLNSMYLRFLCLFMTRELMSPWNEISFSGCLIHSQLKDILAASTFVWTELPPIRVLAFV